MGRSARSLLRSLSAISQTHHEVCLCFDEPVGAFVARLRELSGTSLPAGRGIVPRSTIDFDGDSVRVLEFGRTRLHGRIESLPQRSALVLSTSAPIRKLLIYLWCFKAVWGLAALPYLRSSGEGWESSIVWAFAPAGLLGTFLFPSLWGRGWEFHRIAAALSSRLNASNYSAVQSLSNAGSLARRGAWVSALSAFVWAPLIALIGFPVPLTGRQTTVPPWINATAFLLDSLEIELAILFLFLFVGWALIGGGALCGHCIAIQLAGRSARVCRWTTTALALSFSLGFCWMLSRSETLEGMFYIP